MKVVNRSFFVYAIICDCISVKDFMSGIREIVGGRSGSYEDSLMNARQAAIDEMAKRASKIGANAIIGVSFQYSTVGAQNGMLMVTCNGTAVVV